jgi:hypothetical protein
LPEAIDEIILILSQISLFAAIYPVSLKAISSISLKDPASIITLAKED